MQDISIAFNFSNSCGIVPGSSWLRKDIEGNLFEDKDEWQAWHVIIFEFKLNSKLALINDRWILFDRWFFKLNSKL